MSETPVSPAQVNLTVFGMVSAVLVSACNMLVTTAVKGNELVEKSANTLIYGVSAAENVAQAVEQRSRIYGKGIVDNGELSERAATLKYRLRLAELERQEAAVAQGAAYVEPSLADKVMDAIKSTGIVSEPTPAKTAETEKDEPASGLNLQSAVPIRAS